MPSRPQGPDYGFGGNQSRGISAAGAGIGGGYP